MNLQEVRVFFGYNRWANRLLLQAVSELPTEVFDRDLRGSFASIKGTLRHLQWGERAWLRFWNEGSTGPDLSPTDLPDLPSLEAGWTKLERDQDLFVRELTEERLRAPCPVEENSYTLGELIQHSLNHSTHHRGQVVLMLRQLGRTPPGTGFRQYLTASRSKGA